MTTIITASPRLNEECFESVALLGLPIQLLEQKTDRMDNHNGKAALWFAVQIQNLPAKSV